MEMKSDNGSVRVAFNPAPVPLVTCAAKALAALIVSALARTHLVAVDQFGLLMGGSRPINRGGHNTHVGQPEPFDVDCSGERNGSGGDAPTEKLPSKDEEPKKEQGEPDANGEGEDSEDQADADDADQGDAPEDGGDEDDDDDDGDEDAEDGGDDDDDNEDDEEDDNGPNAEEDVEGGQEEESGADEEDEEDEEELQPPKKRKK